MSESLEGLSGLFREQLMRLGEEHFLILYWSVSSEDKGIKYNITNCFDDLKRAGITRTKQTAVAAVDALRVLCFIDIKDERNRKNLYITRHGGQALQALLSLGLFTIHESSYLKEAVK